MTGIKPLSILTATLATLILVTTLTANSQSPNHGRWVFDPLQLNPQGDFRMTLKSVSGPEATLVLQGNYSRRSQPPTMRLNLLYADARMAGNATMAWRFSDGTKLEGIYWKCMDLEKPCYMVATKYTMTNMTVTKLLDAILDNDTLNVDVTTSKARENAKGIVIGTDKKTTTVRFSLGGISDFVHEVCTKNTCILQGDN